ncbi:MAG: hypothetical protein BZ138_00870 [Methanosphaera sp. rholeuAM270]|nr:MAG: hypothetical protein BZ138_00870 [Methanosphaera sp. rholeuAM270]
MEGSKILGIIIIIALILSVAVVGYNSVTKVTENDEKISQTTEILDESDLNETLSQSENTTPTVNLNINQKLGGVHIEFADNVSTVYNITSNNDQNNTTEVTTNQSEDHLDINVESEKSDNTIILSNKYNYNITCNMVSGGFDVDLNNNSNVDEINVNVTAGGVNINFNGGKLNTLNSMITTGGLNIKGMPTGETVVNSEIEVGGLNLQIDQAIADIFSDIEVGGINPGDYQHTGTNEYKGNAFDSSENKLIIHNSIRLGGVNTQSF